MYKNIIRPILFSFDEEKIHHVTMTGLRLTGKLGLGSALGKFCELKDPALEAEFHGLKFKNPVGLAAGFDKYVRAGEMWGNLGFGFTEFGSTTLRAQVGNPKKRVWRIPEHQSLQNFLGQNNDGAAALVRNFSQIKAHNYVRGISVSSNTELIEPSELENYLACFEMVVEMADYITFNLSCPNVKDHRGLISRGFIDDLLTNVRMIEKKLKIPKPIFIKIPPITDLEKLKEIVEMAEKHKIAGIIATNTKGDFTEEQLGFKLPSPKGGVSGRVLNKYSVETVKLLRLALSSKDILIIGVGGIFNADDALAMIRAGASLVQGYTGFIYEGPMFARRICEGILKEVKRLGLKNYQELIGVGEK